MSDPRNPPVPRADCRLDCDCPKRDPYLCAAHRFDAGDEAVDTDGEEYCLCTCHDDWWEGNEDDRREIATA